MSRKSTEEKRYLNWKNALTQEERDAESRENTYLPCDELLQALADMQIDRERKEARKGSKWRKKKHIEKFDYMIYTFSNFNHKEKLLFELVPLLREQMQPRVRSQISEEKFSEMVRNALSEYVEILRSPYSIESWTSLEMGELLYDCNGCLGVTIFHIQTGKIPQRYVDYAERNIYELADDLAHFVKSEWEEVPHLTKRFFEDMKDIGRQDMMKL